MPLLSISDAARACGVARTTLQRAIRAGRLSLTPERCLDTAELMRAGFQVDAAVLHAAAQQDAAPTRSTVQQGPAASPELQLLRQERDMLRQERDRLMQQVEVLQNMMQTTQQHLTHTQQMLHGMQERYDRLLAMPQASPPAPCLTVRDR